MRRQISLLSYVSVLLVALSVVPANSESLPLGDQLATIAMLEDTRCPDGQQVTRFLTSEDTVVRLRAVRALARLQDSTTVSRLANLLLSDPDVEVRREAAFALGQVGHADGIPSLKNAFADEKDIEIQALSIEALGKIADPLGTPECVRALTSPEIRVQREAGIALWKIADEQALRPLLIALREPEPDVRWTVIYALEKIKNPGDVLPVIEPLATDPSSRVRASVARTLGRQESALALPTLFDLTTDEELNVRVNAVRALGAIGDSSAVPQVLAALNDLHPYVREVAASSLAQLHDTIVSIPLADAGHDAVPAVRAACVISLGELLPENSISLVVTPWLKDESEFVRASACEALGNSMSPDVPATLERILQGTNELGEPAGDRERAAAAAALGELKAEGARTTLVSVLADRDAAVVATAAGALAELEPGDEATINALVEVVRENQNPNEPDIAIGGLEALAKLKSDQALPLATEMVGSAQAQIRAAAESILKEVLGEEDAQEVIAANPPPEWKPAAIAPYREGPPDAHSAVLSTRRGDIVIELFGELSPRTVRNFVDLAESGYFNGSAFHRVVPNFVVQDGDPSGTGWGGPGHSIRCEYNRKRYVVGTVGMALAGKDTGGSQWFITHSPQPHLDGRYTVFGQVVEGLTLLNQLNVEDTIETITIRR